MPLLNLDPMIYDGERRLWKAMQEDTDFIAATQKVLKGNPAFNSRKHLLKKSLHLTPSMAPHIYAATKICQEHLGLKAELDVYVYQDVSFNASCYPSNDRQIYVLLTSALIERFTREELVFVMGHEIGHALLNHGQLPISELLERGEGNISPLQALRLYAWGRACELSADRIGLVCGRDFEIAARAFFKLSSGLADQTLVFQLQDYIRQFEDLSAELAKGHVDTEDMYSSHPFNPLRLKALELFAKSDAYSTLIGRAGAEISKDEMEAKVRGFMVLVEPAALQDGGISAEVVREFIFLAGYLIAGANGIIEPSEIDALASLLDPETMRQGMMKVKDASPQQLDEAMKAVAEKVNLQVAMVGKLNMLRDLAIISYADGSVDDSELEVLYWLSELLAVRPQFIDQVIQSATHGGHR